MGCRARESEDLPVLTDIGEVRDPVGGSGDRSSRTRFLVVPVLADVTHTTS